MWVDGGSWSRRGHSRSKTGYLARSLDGITLCTLYDLIL